MRTKWILLVLFIAIFLSVISTARAEDEWWNKTWKYRVKVEIDSPQDRNDWPVEYEINFTDLFQQAQTPATFQTNSTRVIAYNSTGSVLFEVPSQFETGLGFDAATNALGTLVWQLNGTTTNTTARYYYIYFDRLSNGFKENKTYTSNLYINYTGDGSEEFDVNTTVMRFFIDTVRAQNTSGLYRVAGTELEGNLFNLNSTSRTAEYQEYFNGSHNVTFDIGSRTNFTVGPVRIVVEQTGDEIVWNQAASKTGQANITKRYYFYDGLPWFKVYQSITNTDASSITRNSTAAGALIFDAERIWNNHLSGGNFDEPYSWSWSSDKDGAFLVGIINVNQTGTANFYSYSDTASGRIGIGLNSTSISAGESITDTAALVFNDTSSNYIDIVEGLKDKFERPLNITTYGVQILPIYLIPQTDYPIYNRNETAEITVNVSYDPFDMASYVNVTLDLGTSNTSDDITIILYDDQTHGDSVMADKVYTNSYDFLNSAETGVWNLSATAYNDVFERINETFITFNVTSTYNVSLSINQAVGFINRTVNLTTDVTNYRGDIFILGVLMNCSYNSTYLPSPTDYGNGTYFLQFTAPPSFGSWLLNCTSSKNQNFGYGTGNFSTEGFTANVSMALTPENQTSTVITLNTSDSFNFTVNATTYGNANTYNVNMSVATPQNISVLQSLQECGDILLNQSCNRNFTVTVENATPPGVYTLNVTVLWQNADGTQASNQTTFQILVTSNYIMEVPENNVTGFAARGSNTTIENLTLVSVGNDNITNFTFTAYGFPSGFLFYFEPSAVTYVSPGSNQPFQMVLFVPSNTATGLYNGILNVSSNGGSKNLTVNITVSGTNFTISILPTNHTATTIMWNVSENFTFQSTSKNIGNVTGYSTNISLQLPQRIYSNSSFEQCDDQAENSTCSHNFEIMVENATASGEYLINVTVSWLDPAIGVNSNTTILNVTVTPNVQMEIFEGAISSNSTEGQTTGVGNFTIRSIGNDPINNVSFNVSGLPAGINLTFDPTVTYVNGSTFQLIRVNSTVTEGYNPGTYNGSLNITSTDGSKNITLTIQVPISRTWTINATYCERPMAPIIGTLCFLLVNNTGNMEINFNITPPTGNYTTPNETNFAVQKQNFHIFSIDYNVTDAPVTFHYSYFNLSAVEIQGYPNSTIITVVLNPYIGPLIDLTVTPNETKQLGSIYVWANVTDQSSKGLLWVRINVTTPSNLTFSNTLANITPIGNVSEWALAFPGNWGNTTEKGYYFFLVYSQDSLNITTNDTENVLVYTNMTVSLDMAQNYYQGEHAVRINGTVKDVVNNPIQGANSIVTVLKTDNPAYVIHNQTYTTNSYGGISDQNMMVPTFEIASNELPGNYTIFTNTTFTDAFSKTVIESAERTFNIVSTSLSGLTADIETTVVWYPPTPNESRTITFVIDVYDDKYRPVDPDSMNLTVYRGSPLFNDVYTYIDLSNPIVNRSEAGHYIISFDMLSNTTPGDYWAILKAGKGELYTITKKPFRISSGGPYDVYLNLLEHEVPISDYLDFEIIVENMGEVSQDIDIEYWVSQGNVSWYYASEAIYVASLSNKTLQRTAFIFSNQSLGVYTLNVKVKYSPIDQPILKNETFSVTEAVTTIPSGPAGGGAGAPGTPISPPEVPKVSKIDITSYPQEITIEGGWVKYPAIEVKNIGQTDLHNVQLTVRGIPEEWVTMDPENINVMVPDEVKTFAMRISIPEGTPSNTYNVQLTATSQEAEVSKIFQMLVFASREELIEYEIRKVETSLQDLKNQTEAAREEGRDVDRVLELITEIDSEISNARRFIAENKYDDALRSVITASSLLERAKMVLASAPLIKPGFFDIVPWWLLVLVFLLVLVILFLLIRMKKIKINMLKLMRPIAPEEVKAIEMMKEPLKKETLELEQNKLQRVLNLLDKQRNDGLISKKAYEELKSRNESKLKDIDRKLKRFGKA